MSNHRTRRTLTDQPLVHATNNAISVVYKPYWRESSFVIRNNRDESALYQQVKDMFSKGSVTCKTSGAEREWRRVRITNISVNKHNELVTMMALVSSQQVKSVIRNN